MLTSGSEEQKRAWETNLEVASDTGERTNKSVPTEERADRNELVSPNLGFSDYQEVPVCIVL